MKSSTLKVIPTKAGYIHLGKKPRSVPSAEAKMLVELGFAKFPAVEEVKPAPQTYQTRDMTAARPRAMNRVARRAVPAMPPEYKPE